MKKILSSRGQSNRRLVLRIRTATAANGPPKKRQRTAAEIDVGAVAKAFEDWVGDGGYISMLSARFPHCFSECRIEALTAVKEFDLDRSPEEETEFSRNPYVHLSYLHKLGNPKLRSILLIYQNHGIDWLEVAIRLPLFRRTIIHKNTLVAGIPQNFAQAVVNLRLPTPDFLRILDVVDQYLPEIKSQFIEATGSGEDRQKSPLQTLLEGGKFKEAGVVANRAPEGSLRKISDFFPVPVSSRYFKNPSLVRFLLDYCSDCGSSFDTLRSNGDVAIGSLVPMVMAHDVTLLSLFKKKNRTDLLLGAPFAKVNGGLSFMGSLITMYHEGKRDRLEAFVDAAEGLLSQVDMADLDQMIEIDVWSQCKLKGTGQALFAAECSDLVDLSSITSDHWASLFVEFTSDDETHRFSVIEYLVCVRQDNLALQKILKHHPLFMEKQGQVTWFSSQYLPCLSRVEYIPEIVGIGRYLSDHYGKLNGQHRSRILDGLAFLIDHIIIKLGPDRKQELVKLIQTHMLTSDGVTFEGLAKRSRNTALYRLFRDRHLINGVGMA